MNKKNIKLIKIFTIVQIILYLIISFCAWDLTWIFNVHHLDVIERVSISLSWILFMFIGYAAHEIGKGN